MKKNNPKISIIVPFYNVSKYLNQCLESILKQSFQNFEVIMINDGSTDGSDTIASSFLHDKRFRLIQTTRVGISKCRNIGLEHSLGDYISFIDSDDFVDKHFLSILINEIEDNDLIICDYFDYYEDFKEGFHHTPINSDFISNGNNLFDRYKIPHEACVVPWNKLYKKSVFNGIRYKDSIVHEDEEIFQRIINNSSKIKVIKDKIYYYRKKRFGSIMHSENSESLIMGLNAIESRLSFYLNKNSRQYGINETIVDLYYYLVRNFDNNSFTHTDDYVALKKLCTDMRCVKLSRLSKIIIKTILDINYELRNKHVRNSLFIKDLICFIKNNSLFNAIRALSKQRGHLNIHCNSTRSIFNFGINSYYFMKKYKNRLGFKQINIYAENNFESVTYDAIEFFKNTKINLYLKNTSKLNWYQKELINSLRKENKINVIFQ